MTSMVKVLLDTSIIAYLFARSTSELKYRVRALLAEKLLTHHQVNIVLYEEQIEIEIYRALNELVITRIITHSGKREIIRNIYRDFTELIEECQRLDKCIVVKKSDEYISRASTLFRHIESCFGSREARRSFRGIGGDLVLMAVAEKEDAAILTADYSTMYRVYTECLYRRRAIRIPAIYYLEVDPRQHRASYRVCGERIHVLEKVLNEVCAEESIQCTSPRLDCQPTTPN